MSTFKTIRQTAATGVLPEHRLRIMQKQNLLPGVWSGQRFLVNIEALSEMLEAESRAQVAGVDNAQ